jgi:AI-2 transport protein TqsA|eukprot:SAG25_NODE_471_length_7659_cov_3.676720_9_plen_131_part_00
MDTVRNTEFLGDAATFLLNFSFGLILTLILTIFMLCTSDISPVNGHASVQQKLGQQIRRYIQLKSVVCLGLGAGMALFLAAIHCQAPLLFGAITFLVNYIPNFGCIVACPAHCLALRSTIVYPDLTTWWY